MPDKMRKSHVLRDIECTSTLPELTNTIAQQNITMTDVLIAVARFELIPDTPTLARRAVTPAKNADPIAQMNHCIRLKAFPDSSTSRSVRKRVRLSCCFQIYLQELKSNARAAKPSERCRVKDRMRTGIAGVTNWTARAEQAP